jgi:hypothetical protein
MNEYEVDKDTATSVVDELVELQIRDMQQLQQQQLDLTPDKQVVEENR